MADNQPFDCMFCLEVLIVQGKVMRLFGGQGIPSTRSINVTHLT